MLIFTGLHNTRVIMELKTHNEIICTAHIIAKKETRETVLKILTDLIKPSKNEPGCLSYTLHCNVEDPNMFTFIDKFKDKQAFDYHCETAHIVEAFDKLLPSLVEKMDLSIHHEICFEDS